MNAEKHVAHLDTAKGNQTLAEDDVPHIEANRIGDPAVR